MEAEEGLIDKVLSKVKNDPCSADFQISLFMSALQNYRHDSLLRPFPSSYLHENGEKNTDSLKDVANRIPRVSKLRKSKQQISNDVWNLIDWITELKNKKIVQSPTASKFNEITKKTENSKNYHTPSHIFEIKYDDASNAKFDELRQEMDILYGYHGSRVENFYSILHNGLHAHLNKTSLFGEGTYLSSDLNVSILYSKFGEGWKHSRLGNNLSCIAVCEIIDHPDVKRSVQGPGRQSRSRAQNSEGGDVPEKYFVVTNNQFVRVKYILVYTSSGYRKYFYQSLWVFRHPLASLVIIYVFCLLLLGISRTNGFQQFYKRLWRT
ncbi:protein mono-ADP-ribosyltransferase PARP16-like [Dendronephthya gigantea]|uniref:protein mono-ADP-ribosyltransferase PARP16-like n=1 Tax=Dendronephthya gigantea TaxID=151771 RepID=UPI00106C26E8|nr:protein mono-ADP-ribosyltransferase PARP16-like [Dendronephthya gigantea]